MATFLLVLLVLPGGAGAFGVENLKFEQSSLQASSHPYASLSFDRTGSESEDIKDMNIELPAGVFANPEAANPKCTSTQFTSDACPANSQVGEIQVKVKAMSLLDLTINGSVYVLTPEANQTATLGVTLRPDQICLIIVCAVPQKIFLKTGATLRTYGDQGLTASAPGTTSSASIGIPLVLFTPTINADITINHVDFKFYGRTGQFTKKRVCGGFLNLSCKDVVTAPQGPYFFRQTASCTPATIKVELISKQGVPAEKSTSYTPTGCNNVPYNPTVSFGPHNADAGESTPVDFVLASPEADAEIQHALPKLVDINLPAGSGLNLANLADVVGCTETQLRQAACPESSIIGHAGAFSKYLPGPTPTTPGLAGNVYAMGVGNQIPIAVELKGRGNTVVLFRGLMGTRGDGPDARVYSTFDQVPELPYSSIAVTIDKAVYKNPQICGAANTAATMTGFHGGSVDRSTSYEVINCPQPPNTTLTGAPPTNSSIVQPKFFFESSEPDSTFQCRIDDAPFEPCSSPFQSEPLPSSVDKETNEIVHTYRFEVKAIKGAFEDPTPVSYEFNVLRTGFVVTPNIQVGDDPDHPHEAAARSHPDATASFEITGGNPRQVSLRLPDGLVASLSAREQCDLDDATAPTPTCSEASKVGIGAVTVDFFNPASGQVESETSVGAGFLTEAPTSNDAAGVMATTEFSFGRLTVVGGAYLVNNGRNQYLTLREVPQIVNGPGGLETQINVTHISVELDGSTNELVTAPSQCEPSSFLSTGLDWDDPANDSEVFNVPFQATGCDELAFGPQVNQILSNPVAGQESAVSATVTLGADDAGISQMRVTEPPSISPNFPAFGQPQDQCPVNSVTDEGAFDPALCPAQAKVGTMALHTPLLPYVLDGSVYLIEASPIPWLGVSFNKPGIVVGLVGVTSTPKVNPSCNPLITPGGCKSQISVVFDGIPDVPIDQVDFTLDGPSRTGQNGATLSGKMLRVASPTDPSCSPLSPAKSNISAQNGAVINQEQQIAISGCL